MYALGVELGLGLLTVMDRGEGYIIERGASGKDICINQVETAGLRRSLRIGTVVLPRQCDEHPSRVLW